MEEMDMNIEQKTMALKEVKVRVTPDQHKAIKALVKAINSKQGDTAPTLSQSAVILMAIADLCEREGIPFPDDEIAWGGARE